MAAYAPILTPIAMMIYGSYLALGSNVRFVISGVDSALTTGYHGAAEERGKQRVRWAGFPPS